MMEIIDLAAIIGAASWLPHIMRFFFKTKLKIIPESTIEIGYSFLGPVLNPTLAFSASRKEALIVKIIIEVIHQEGEKHRFLWQVLDEKGFEGTSSKGEKLEMRRSQSATALKVGTIGLVERKVLFQEIAFKENRLTLESRLREKEALLLKTDKGNSPENIFRSEEFIALNESCKRSFCWKEGEYSITIEAHEATLKKPHIERYKLKLTKINSDLLEKNIYLAQELNKAFILFRTGNLPEVPIYPWNWIYPTIE